MRKTSALIFVLIVLLAGYSSTTTVFAKSHTSSFLIQTNYLTGSSHPYFQIAADSGARSGLVPKQLRNAYKANLLKNKGHGITIAIIDAYGNPNAQSDLNSYDNAYDLPPSSITVVYPEGKPAVVDQAWALETDLDIQMVHIMAPKAKIVLVAARSSTDGDLYAAVKDAYLNQGASIVSMSFGSYEYINELSANADGIFSMGNRLGVSFVASSGDGGSGAQYPAASPFVTAVGGTTLNVQSDGTYISETAWHGSGGGISAFEQLPSYQ